MEVERTAPQIAREAVRLMGAPFAAEKQAKDAPAAERLAVRKTQLVPVLAELGEAGRVERPLLPKRPNCRAIRIPRGRPVRREPGVPDPGRKQQDKRSSFRPFTAFCGLAALAPGPFPRFGSFLRQFFFDLAFRNRSQELISRSGIRMVTFAHAKLTTNLSTLTINASNYECSSIQRVWPWPGFLPKTRNHAGLDQRGVRSSI